jgi:hypothetical protein
MPCWKPLPAFFEQRSKPIGYDCPLREHRSNEKNDCSLSAGARVFFVRCGFRCRHGSFDSRVGGWNRCFYNRERRWNSS